MISRLTIACFCAAFCVAANAQGGVMSRPAQRAQIESHWKKTYPAEKILNIEHTGQSRSSSMGRHGHFHGEGAIVTVERADNSRARFRVETIYKAVSGPWRFERVEVERPAP